MVDELSIEVKVISTTANYLRCGDVTGRVVESFDPAARARWGDVLSLIAVPEGDRLPESESVRPLRVYRFVFPVPCDLELFVYASPFRDRPGTYEQAYLEEHAPNLDADARREVAARWAVGGHSYSVQSGVSRVPGEIDLLVAVATAIGELCAGWIIVANAALLGCREGAYTPEQLRSAHRPQASLQ